MTTMVDKIRCVMCAKGKGVWKCIGCSRTFCDDHVAHHRQELATQMGDVENECDNIRQTLTDKVRTLNNDAIMERINRWENELINKIKKAAEDVRLDMIEHAVERVTDLENRLNTLSEEIRDSRDENNYYETDISRWKAILDQLEKDLQDKLYNFNFQEDSIPLVNQFPVNTTEPTISVPSLPLSPMRNYKKWSKNGITITSRQESGNGKIELCNPVRVFLDDNDQSMYIADHRNNRIVKWKQNTMCDINASQKFNQLNCPGDTIMDVLNDNLIICDIGNRQILQWPRHRDEPSKTIISDIKCWGLAMDDQGNLYVSDYERHEVRRWQIGDTKGTIVAGGNRRGNGLHQLDSPTSIFVDDEQSVYVCDSFNHRIVKWKLGAKEGIIVAGNGTEGNDLTQLSCPNGILVDEFGTVYVADTNNHRIMRWLKDSTEGSIVVGGNKHGNQSNQLYNPRGLATDQRGNLYVVDSSNHRVQKFPIQSN